jgi:hypothetical protein
MPDARLKQAAVLRHLADLAQRHPDDFGEAWGDPVADYLERSLKADPDHLPATLALLDRYRKADSPKDWHQATEQAVRRFPGNPAVLLHAVDAAVACSAYKKAAGFARRLLTRLRGLGVFSMVRPLPINGLAGKVCTTGGGEGRWQSAVAAEAADLA